MILRKIGSALLLIVVLFSCKKDDSNGTTTTTQDCTKNHLRLGTKIVIQSNSGAKDTGVVNKDTTVNGLQFFGSYSKGLFSSYTGICVQSNGNVYQYSKDALFLPDGVFPITTTSQSVGQSLYSDSIPNAFSTTLKYVYQSKLLGNNETFSLNGKTYTNGKKILLMLNKVSSISPLTIDTLTTSYYFCGLGVVKKEQSGIVTQTMIDYTY